MLGIKKTAEFGFSHEFNCTFNQIFRANEFVILNLPFALTHNYLIFNLK
jgi:hypothetical protein